MKVKVSESSGPVLDWMVAKAEERGPVWNMDSHGRTWHGWWLSKGGEYEVMPRYSTDWAQGGQILARERIATIPSKPNWVARIQNPGDPLGDWLQLVGPTPLIAALRCYAVSKLGEEVEVPDELC